jgi:CheY-like chemotaxis protein
VELRISLVPNQDSSSKKLRVRFEIEDSGIGIAPKDIPLLFQWFSQIGREVQAHSGVGLGLSISRSLVELLGGEIGVQSVPGQGTTFWFEIPLIKGEETRVSRVASPVVNQKVSLAGLRILVVEDNEINQMVIASFIGGAGGSCELVADGQSAIEACSSFHYDLVLMDIQLPEMDGITATQHIRDEADPNEPALKILAISADTQSNIQKHVESKLMDGFVTKPFQREQLITLIAQFTGRIPCDEQIEA